MQRSGRKPPRNRSQAASPSSTSVISQPERPRSISVSAVRSMALSSASRIRVFMVHSGGASDRALEAGTEAREGLFDAFEGADEV